MKFDRIAILSIPFLLLPLTVFCDGGTLSLQILAPDDESAAWVMEEAYCPILNRVEKQIRGEETIAGYMSYYPVGPQSTHLLPTDTKPIRLFCDFDGDETFTASEECKGTDGTDISKIDERIFRNVRLATLPGPISESFQIDIFSWRKDSTSTSKIQMQVFQCKNVYEGTLQAGGKDYNARLLFKDLFSLQTAPNTILILDCNRDGHFNPFDDTWFLSNGIASIDGSLWNVKTQYENQTVNVTLSPYSGFTGTLHLQGDGISQVVIGQRRPGSSDPLQEVSLLACENNAFQLPVATYTISKVWLRSKEQPDIAYQWPMKKIYDVEECPEIRIEQDRESAIHVGGPLRDTLTVSKPNILGQIVLEYKGGMNNNGLGFYEINWKDLLHCMESQSPMWILEDSRGNRIHTGQFIYNHASIHMPWGYGTYRIQCSGSTNELLKRSPVEFVYYPTQLIILGIFTLILMAIIVFLSKIDRCGFRSKWWVLLPGILGSLWIYACPSTPDVELITIGFGPLLVTIFLLACRIVLPRRISSVFITSILSSFIVLTPCLIQFNYDYITLFCITCLLYAVLFSAFCYAICNRNSQWRFRMDLSIVIGIPIIAYIGIAIQTGYFYGLLGVSIYVGCFLLPLYFLTVWNPWVRDLIVHRMMAGDEDNRPEKNERVKPEA